MLGNYQTMLVKQFFFMKNQEKLSNLVV